MKILKFGGTSLGSAERMQNVANIINDGQKKIIVLSAYSGATNDLVAIADCLYKNDKASADQLISNFQQKGHDYVAELFTNEGYVSQAKEIIDNSVDQIRSFTIDMFTPFEEKSVLAQGELISTSLFHLYLQSVGIKSVFLPALNFMRIDREREPDYYYIQENLERELSNYADESLFITQGFICRNAFGEVDNLQRGGSDYSASLIGAAIEAEEIQIWTDIDGMHNNDPRYIKNTKPIEQLSFHEAAELAYFGAKILHPSSIVPARNKNIPVRLKNTLAPEAKGTIISKKTDETGIKAIAAKDDITVINIQSDRMLLAYGFLKKVFEIFEIYKTPIDMITTSEVAVSVTIDHTGHLEKIVEDLHQFGQVTVKKNFTIICVVGAFQLESKGYAGKILQALSSTPVQMISYGASEHNISLLVDKKHKKEALQQLNTSLFQV